MCSLIAHIFVTANQRNQRNIAANQKIQECEKEGLRDYPPKVAYSIHVHTKFANLARNKCLMIPPH